MKKTSLIIVMVALLTGGLPSAGKIFIALNANLIYPNDGQYRDLYGSTAFNPEVHAGFKLSRSFFIWAGYSLFNSQGNIPELGDPAEASQNFISLGLGYEGRISFKLKWQIRAGACRTGFKEETMGSTSSDSLLGFEVAGGLKYFFKSRFFFNFLLSFLSGSTTINGVKITTGGLRSGFGLGIFF